MLARLRARRPAKRKHIGDSSECDGGTKTHARTRAASRPELTDGSAVGPHSRAGRRSQYFSKSPRLVRLRVIFEARNTNPLLEIELGLFATRRRHVFRRAGRQPLSH